MAGKTGVDFPRRGTVPPEVENSDLCVVFGAGMKQAGDRRWRGMGEAIEGESFQFGGWA